MITKDKITYFKEKSPISHNLVLPYQLYWQTVLSSVIHEPEENGGLRYQNGVLKRRFPDSVCT